MFSGKKEESLIGRDPTSLRSCDGEKEKENLHIGGGKRAESSSITFLLLISSSS